MKKTSEELAEYFDQLALQIQQLNEGCEVIGNVLHNWQNVFNFVQPALNAIIDVFMKGSSLKRLAIHLAPIWSSPYDPYIPKEGAAGGPPSKTLEIQKKIDETVEVMRDNLKSVAERGVKLDTLQDKTGKEFMLESKEIL
ncbi:3864_t:CDS:2 [Entrophospora sp. SA101]|nr:2383_t:CDS:2 [Entrophospora sp. SA101]CAJ0892806.1 3864_t:CDS:2 [Entrophospora sp. SA101]